MSEPVSLAERRWERGNGDPANHTLRDMLETVIAKLDSGELVAEHMIVMWGRNDGIVGDDGYFQAGTFTAHAQIGLVHRAIVLLTEGGE